MTPTQVRQASFIFPLALTALWLGLMAWGLSVSITLPTDRGWAVSRFVEGVSGYALWTAGWAWVTHVLQGQSRLSSHVTIVAVAGVIDELVLSLGAPWLFFAMGWSWPQEMNQLQWGALVVATSFFNLRVACNSINRQLLGLWLLAVFVSGSLYALKIWANLNEKEALKNLPFVANIYPAFWVKTPELGVDEGLRELWGRGNLVKPLER